MGVILAQGEGVSACSFLQLPTQVNLVISARQPKDGWMDCKTCSKERSAASVDSLTGGSAIHIWLAGRASIFIDWLVGSFAYGYLDAKKVFNNY